MPSQLTENLFGAIDKIAENRVNSSKQDTTISGEVVAIKDFTTGEYQISYQGGTFSAYSLNQDKVYSVGEQVYVLVPQGDFSTKKVILGLSNYNSTNAEAENAMPDVLYLDRGPNLVGPNGYDIEDNLGICVCKEENKDKLYDDANFAYYAFIRELPDVTDGHTYYHKTNLDVKTLEVQDKLLYEWSKTYKMFKVQADFQTEMIGEHYSGEYMLNVIAEVENTNFDNAQAESETNWHYADRTFTFSFGDFSGNSPFQIPFPSTQTAYFEVPGNLTRIKAVCLIQDGNIEADMPLTFTDKAIISDESKANYRKNNVLISNLEIKFIEKVVLQDQNDYAWIECPNGNVITNDNAVDLVPHYQWKGQDLVGQELCEVRWFRQKLRGAMNIADLPEKDEHNKTSFDYSGFGWYPIQKIIDERGENEELQYEIIDNKLIIHPAAVPFKFKYKCVISYWQAEKKNDGTDSGTYKELESKNNFAIQEVSNRYSKYDLNIVENPEHILSIIDNNNPFTQYDGYWCQDNAEGKLLEINKDAVQTINIENILLKGSTTFLAECFDPYRTEYNVSEEIAVLELSKLAAGANDVEVEWRGSQTFTYTSDNKLKFGLTRKEQEFVLTPIVHFAENTGGNYFINLYGPDGILLPVGTTPSDGRVYAAEQLGNTQKANYMVKSAYRTIGNSIYFTIQDVYDPNSSDSTFVAEIGLASGEVLKSSCKINFSIDGRDGTIGNEWVAQIKPCNYKEDNVSLKFSQPLSGLNPLVVVPYTPADGRKKNSYTTYTVDEIGNTTPYRLFLRPFISKQNIPIEDLDPSEGYYFEARWSVQIPKYYDELAKYSSYLRLYEVNQNGTINIFPSYADSDIEAQRNGTTKVAAQTYNEKENTKEGLIGYTTYPNAPSARQVSKEGSYNIFDASESDTFGTVEVRFFDNLNYGTGASLKECNYHFQVKCQIDICRRAYNDDSQKIQTETAKEVIASIVSFYPVDIFFNEGKINLVDDKDQYGINDNQQANIFSKIKTNWPTEVYYDSFGRADQVDAIQRLQFGIDGGFNYFPESYTPNIINVKEHNGDASLQFKTHLNFGELMNGAMATKKTDGGLLSSGWYLRNLIIRLKGYDNVDINSWDGQGLDMNEEDGTLFGAVLGAGYKNPLTNKFTGLIMGKDSSQPRERENEDYNPGFDYNINSYAPYLTGLFGLQDGEKSFGLFENGTAFFGKASGGGRIWIDGNNAVICGGLETPTSPSIKDSMSNRMRINLMDLTHLAKSNTDIALGNLGESIVMSTDEDNECYDKAAQNAAGKAIAIGENGTASTKVEDTYFGFSSDSTANSKEYLPEWYAKMWKKAYIKEDGYLPYWLGDKNNPPIKYEELPWYTTVGGTYKNSRVNYFGNHTEEDSTEYFPIEIEREDGSGDKFYIKYLLEPWDVIINLPNGFEYKGITYKILPHSAFVRDVEGNDNKYEVWRYSGKESVGIITINEYFDGNLNSKLQDADLNISNFGAGRASTTPAIEIGEHPEGLMPGLIDYDDYEDIFKHLRIPGNRNFMVTYDGTMWANNGIFMGAVIGSSIVGGRIMGAELGLGDKLDKDTPVIQLDDVVSSSIEQKLINARSSKIEVSQVSPWKDSQIFRNFIVDPQGNVGMYSAKIIGGEIDIGDFHVRKETVNNVDYSILLNQGYSRFSGEVFLTPVFEKEIWVEDELGQHLCIVEKESPRGNLIQAGAEVALGIPTILKEKDVRESELKWGQGLINQVVVDIQEKNYNIENENEPKKLKMLFQHLTSQSVVSDFWSLNSCENSSIQRLAPFYISGKMPKNGDINVGGHLWPLAMKTTNIFRETYDSDHYTLEVERRGYLTMMDMFKTPKDKNSPFKYFRDNDGANYFRISPSGNQMNQLFIRERFQDESKDESTGDIINEVEGKDYSLADIAQEITGNLGVTTELNDKIFNLQKDKQKNGVGICSNNNKSLILKSDFSIRNFSRKNISLNAGQILGKYTRQIIDNIPTDTFTPYDADFHKAHNIFENIDLMYDDFDEIHTIFPDLLAKAYDSFSSEGAGVWWNNLKAKIIEEIEEKSKEIRLNKEKSEIYLLCLECTVTQNHIDSPDEFWVKKVKKDEETNEFYSFTRPSPEEKKMLTPIDPSQYQIINNQAWYLEENDLDGLDNARNSTSNTLVKLISYDLPLFVSEEYPFDFRFSKSHSQYYDAIFNGNDDYNIWSVLNRCLLYPNLCKEFSNYPLGAVTVRNNSIEFVGTSSTIKIRDKIDEIFKNLFEKIDQIVDSPVTLCAFFDIGNTKSVELAQNAYKNQSYPYISQDGIVSEDTLYAVLMGKLAGIQNWGDLSSILNKLEKLKIEKNGERYKLLDNDDVKTADLKQSLETEEDNILNYFSKDILPEIQNCSIINLDNLHSQFESWDAKLEGDKPGTNYCYKLSSYLSDVWDILNHQEPSALKSDFRPEINTGHLIFYLERNRNVNVSFLSILKQKIIKIVDPEQRYCAAYNLTKINLNGQSIPYDEYPSLEDSSIEMTSRGQISMLNFLNIGDSKIDLRQSIKKTYFPTEGSWTRYAPLSNLFIMKGYTDDSKFSSTYLWQYYSKDGEGIHLEVSKDPNQNCQNNSFADLSEVFISKDIKISAMDKIFITSEANEYSTDHHRTPEDSNKRFFGILIGGNSITLKFDKKTYIKIAEDGIHYKGDLIQDE